MRYFILAFALSIVAVSHAGLLSWETEVSLGENKADWIASFEYSENVSRSDYFVLSGIEDLSVTADGFPINCDTEVMELGTSITCSDINARKVVYNFRTRTEPSQGLMRFSYRFSVTSSTDRFYVVISLPLGTAIVEKERLEGTGLKRF